MNINGYFLKTKKKKKIIYLFIYRPFLYPIHGKYQKCTVWFFIALLSTWHFDTIFVHVLFSSIKVHFLRITDMGKVCIPGQMDPNTQETFI